MEPPGVQKLSFTAEDVTPPVVGVATDDVKATERLVVNVVDAVGGEASMDVEDATCVVADVLLIEVGGAPLVAVTVGPEGTPAVPPQAASSTAPATPPTAPRAARMIARREQEDSMIDRPFCLRRACQGPRCCYAPSARDVPPCLASLRD